MNETLYANKNINKVFVSCEGECGDKFLIQNKTYTPNSAALLFIEFIEFQFIQYATKYVIYATHGLATGIVNKHARVPKGE